MARRWEGLYKCSRNNGGEGTPFSCGDFWYVMKNCDAFVLGPLLAMESIPRLPCCAGRAGGALIVFTLERHHITGGGLHG